MALIQPQTQFIYLRLGKSIKTGSMSKRIGLAIYPKYARVAKGKLLIKGQYFYQGTSQNILQGPYKK